jgi:hypothetical protein
VPIPIQATNAQKAPLNGYKLQRDDKQPAFVAPAPCCRDHLGAKPCRHARSALHETMKCTALMRLKSAYGSFGKSIAAGSPQYRKRRLAALHPLLNNRVRNSFQTISQPVFPGFPE